MIYPDSVPEFRILEKVEGQQVLQIRYICAPVGYTGQWQDIPIVKEDADTTNEPS